MGFLWVFYNNTYQSYPFKSKPHEEITIGSKLEHTITIQSDSIKQFITIVKGADSSQLKIYLGESFIGYLNGHEEQMIALDNISLRIVYRDSTFLEKMYYVGNEKEIYLPTESMSQTNVAYSMLHIDGKWLIEPRTKNTYVNGEEIYSITEVSSGDIIFYPYITVTLTDHDAITVLAKEDYMLPLVEMKLPTSVMKERYPNYRRTPRMIYDLPEDKVEFSFPREETDYSGRGLLMIILPPLVMLIVMGVVALVRPRGIFMLISIAMFTTTIITSSVQYFRERRKQRDREERRQRLYSRYMETKREELEELAQKQREVLFYHFPSFERMKYLASEINDRIWERTRNSNDFLQFRIGRATIPSSYKVSVNSLDMSNQEIDELLEKSQELVEHYKKVDNVPLVIDLSKGFMGIVGKESVVKHEIHQIVGQLSFFHSYHDVRFVAIFHEEEYESWQWMKWLPHFQLPHVYAKGLIYNEITRDQLLTSIYEMIKERDLTEDKDKRLFSPHFIFIVTNRQLIAEHVILEYLEGTHSNIGISTIFAEDTKESLSENVNTLVRYIDEGNGDIVIQDKKAAHLPFMLDKHSTEDNEVYARLLKSLNHQLGMSNSIPEKVTFLELLNAEQVTDIKMEQKWIDNHSAKSLAVPIGLKGKDDPVYLNLHEKGHGPHGLLAGTTGSGKSEFLQTYILSLAVHFHPHEVAFLLIDYKGGGMAQPFKNMPHLLGTITNIDGSKNFSKRALASIKSELKRRQRLFDVSEVNHINDYSDLYKRGRVQQPMPHLFIISDEFAELKSEEPEFIRELVSAARIGRSLGVHLILATQKPGGIIDDQIWSNSRFKIALKVQDESDSREILKNPDASNITVTGRGYLQVGNNEVYELFQSAWSGAPYAKDAFDTEDEIALVTDLGLVPLTEVTADVGGKKESKVEIDVVVDEIIQTQQRLQIPKVASPWLPPLSERLVLPKDEQTDRHQIIMGLMDEPELQRQENYIYHAMEDGNIGVFGSSGFGKSMTLITFLLQLSRMNSPEQFQMYLFDFGNGAMLPLKQLPHTADYFQSDEQRKIEKFFSVMQLEMESRKQLFQEQEVSNIKMYNAIASTKLPLIFLTIDNYDMVKDEMFEQENKFIQIARDGQSLGIYLAISATRPNAMKQAMTSNIKTKIVHYLMDESEKFNLVGRTTYETEAIPGRAYIKKEDASLVQIYLPTAGTDDVALLENIKLDIQTIKENYRYYKKPKPIPMLPKKLGFETLYKKYDISQSKGLVAIGLDEETVEPVYVDWQRHRHCIVMADGQKGKTNIMKILLHNILDEHEQTQVALVDSIARSLSDYADEDNVTYLETKEHIQLWIEAAETEFKQRETTYRHALEERRASSLSFPPIVLVVDGMGQFQQSIDSIIQGKLSNMLKGYSHLGFRLVVGGNVNEISKGFDALTTEVKQIKQIILLMKKSEQNLVNLPYTRNESEIHAGFGYYVDSGNAVKIQIPQYDIERVKMNEI